MRQEFSKAVKIAIQNELLNGLHTVMPGKVMKYDAKEGTATIKPIATTYFNGKAVDYPELYEVPVVFPRFGAIEFSAPVEKNDQVLVFFTERNLGKWMEEDKFPQSSPFSLRNAIAILGCFYGPGELTEQANEDKSLMIKNGELEISITDGTMYIKGDVVIDGTLIHG